ncbi:MAG TPA: GrpB family protein [Pseudonocardiaceae bacterium]
MPLPDELASDLTVVNYDPEWPRQFQVLAARLKAALGRLAHSVDHIGSTSVPGLIAKDCIDVQVQVDLLVEEVVVPVFSAIGSGYVLSRGTVSSQPPGSGGQSWYSLRRLASEPATFMSARRAVRPSDATCCSEIS